MNRFEQKLREQWIRAHSHDLARGLLTVPWYAQTHPDEVRFFRMLCRAIEADIEAPYLLDRYEDLMDAQPFAGEKTEGRERLHMRACAFWVGLDPTRDPFNQEDLDYFNGRSKPSTWVYYGATDPDEDEFCGGCGDALTPFDNGGPLCHQCARDTDDEYDSRDDFYGDEDRYYGGEDDE
jgi:hypothetical protein